MTHCTTSRCESSFTSCRASSAAHQQPVEISVDVIRSVSQANRPKELRRRRVTLKVYSSARRSGILPAGRNKPSISYTTTAIILLPTKDYVDQKLYKSNFVNLESTDKSGRLHTRLQHIASLRTICCPTIKYTRTKRSAWVSLDLGRGLPPPTTAMMTSPNPGCPGCDSTSSIPETRRTRILLVTVMATRG